MGEYADRNTNDEFAENSDGSLTGDVVHIGSAISLQTGYVLQSNIAVTGRYTNINFDKIVTNNNDIIQYTLGLSKYFEKHKLKIQSDMTYENSIFLNDKIFFRLQFEIHF